jgi:hypothetical protein
MDHLWDQVKDHENLKVILRDPRLVVGAFSDVPVAARWTHESDSEEDIDTPQSSRLSFIIPEFVVGRVQSEHAGKLMRRFFGSDNSHGLDKPFLPDTAYVPQRVTSKNREEHLVRDWPTLKRAIEMTASDMGGELGGQRVTTEGPTNSRIARQSPRRPLLGNLLKPRCD